MLIHKNCGLPNFYFWSLLNLYSVLLALISPMWHCITLTLLPKFCYFDEKMYLGRWLCSLPSLPLAIWYLLVIILLSLIQLTSNNFHLSHSHIKNWQWKNQVVWICTIKVIILSCYLLNCLYELTHKNLFNHHLLYELPPTNWYHHCLLYELVLHIQICSIIGKKLLEWIRISNVYCASYYLSFILYKLTHTNLFNHQLRASWYISVDIIIAFYTSLYLSIDIIMNYYNITNKICRFVDLLMKHETH